MNLTAMMLLQVATNKLHDDEEASISSYNLMSSTTIMTMMMMMMMKMSSRILKLKVILSSSVHIMIQQKTNQHGLTVILHTQIISTLIMRPLDITNSTVRRIISKCNFSNNYQSRIVGGMCY